MQTEFNDQFDWLAHLEFFGVKLGLQQTRLLFDELGAPDRQLKFKQDCAAPDSEPASIPRRTWWTSANVSV